MKRCPYQGKKKHHTKLDAILSQRNAPWWNQMRAYECPHCGFWHLTSQPDLHSVRKVR